MPDILFPQDTSAKATPTTSDLILLADVADSNNPKDATLGSLPISTATQTALDAKQATLVSGTNIKTINSQSILGSGDLVISGGGGVSDGDKGDITVSGSGSVWTIDNSVVTVAKLSATGTPSGSTFLRGDGTWSVPSGAGDVAGPASSTDSVPALFDGTTGKILKNSTPTGTGNPVLQTSPTLTTPTIALLNGQEIRATGAAGIELENSGATACIITGAGGGTGTSIVGTTNIASASADYHQFTGGTGTITNTATGSSSNININEVPKGTGRFQVGGVNVPTISSTDTLTNKDISSATNTYRSASDTTTGAVELATAAETTTGTDATRAVTPDGLSGSEFGKRTVAVLLSGSASGDAALATGDGLAALPIDTTLNGMNLVAIKAYVSTESSSGAPLFQVRRSRRSSATARTTVDMLSTGVSIDASEFESADATTAAVINTSNDDVQTGDILLFDCDTAGTGTKGAQLLLTFQLP